MEMQFKAFSSVSSLRQLSHTNFRMINTSPEASQSATPSNDIARSYACVHVQHTYVPREKRETKGVLERVREKERKRQGGREREKERWKKGEKDGEIGEEIILIVPQRTPSRRLPLQRHEWLEFDTALVEVESSVMNCPSAIATNGNSPITRPSAGDPLSIYIRSATNRLRVNIDHLTWMYIFCGLSQICVQRYINVQYLLHMSTDRKGRKVKSYYKFASMKTYKNVT